MDNVLAGGYREKSKNVRSIKLCSDVIESAQIKSSKEERETRKKPRAWKFIKIATDKDRFGELCHRHRSIWQGIF